MLRALLGAIAGTVAWFIVALGLGTVVQKIWPDFAEAIKTNSYTVPIMAARLGLSFLGSLLGGILASRISGERRNAALAMGVIMLVIFVPYHLSAAVWPHFPLWYHLSFFVSLIVLPLIGARLVSSR